MNDDPIVDEVRRLRDLHAASFHYDLDAIFRDVKEQEKKSGRKFVSFTRIRVEANQSPQPTEPGGNGSGEHSLPTAGDEGLKPHAS